MEQADRQEVKIKQKQRQKRARAAKRREKARETRALELEQKQQAHGHIIRAFSRHGDYDPTAKQFAPHSDTGSLPVKLALAIYDRYRLVRHNQRGNPEGEPYHVNDTTSRRRLGEAGVSGYVRNLIMQIDKTSHEVTIINEPDLNFLRQQAQAILSTRRPSDIAFKVAEVIAKMLAPTRLEEATAEEVAYLQECQNTLWSCHSIEIWNGQGKNPVPWCQLPTPWLVFYFTNKSGRSKRIGVLPCPTEIAEGQQAYALPQAERAIKAHIAFLSHKFRFFRGEEDLQVLGEEGIAGWKKFNQSKRGEERAQKKVKSPRPKRRSKAKLPNRVL